MTSPSPTPSTDQTLEAAATWLARLQAGDRTQADLDGFRDWQRADPANAAAFDKVNSAYQAIGALKDDPAFAQRPRIVDRRALLTGAAAAMVASVAVATLRPGHAAAYETRTGEQRRVSLPDGTRVTLDTQTRLVVDAQTRTARLIRGRAFFETPRATPTFAIGAGDCQISAPGAQVEVSRLDREILVCVLEGAAELRRGDQATALLQGQRLRTISRSWFEPAQPLAAPQIDQPDLRALTAWRAGQLVFADTSLDEAVEEMNRYSDRKIVLADPELGALRISGAYSTGDPVAFVRSVALLLDLGAADQDGRLILTRNNS